VSRPGVSSVPDLSIAGIAGQDAESAEKP